ncbi:MAG TPA: RCC1 repeat- and reductase domain-containing protein [bacterium]|nr:RCC1 repeat- and reductase domain-containing protein [bacterium]
MKVPPFVPCKTPIRLLLRPVPVLIALATALFVGSCGQGNATIRVPGASTSVVQCKPVECFSAGVGVSVALKSDDTLWSWGLNSKGQLGDGTTTSSSVPVQEITGSSDWVAVSAGGDMAVNWGHTVALKTDGTVWNWGTNTHSELGLVGPTSSSSPVQESSGANDWVAVSAGGYHTMALKANGTIWSWGWNLYGQLGDGTTTTSAVPVQEATGATDWVAISCGYRYSAALKSDGSLWLWGLNNVGQLGDGTLTQRNVPTQEASLATNWVRVSTGAYAPNPHTVALKSDGSLWAWGYNALGQLGDGTTTNSSVPIREATNANDWVDLSGARDQTSALKSDGSAWDWGGNTNGEIGDGTTTNSFAPVEENTFSLNWIAIHGGSGYTMALKADGTLWAWGKNGTGELGDGTTTNRLNPVEEVTGATDWGP